jgi:parvulin-like peptidyl-prolyl isomerase
MQHQSRKAWLVAMILLSAFSGGTALAQTKTIEEIVAWVNNEVILKSEYEARKATIRAELAAPAERKGKGLQGPQLEQAFNEQSKVVLQQLIDEALVLQQARDMGLSANLEITKTMDRLRQEQKLDSLEALEKAIVDAGYNLDDFQQNIRVQFLWDEVMKREVYPRMTITTEEGRKYYDSHVKDFDRPAGVRVREITIVTENRSPEGIEQQRKKAEEALAAVKKGDDFGQVAAKYSESDAAQNGGDLGFYAKGELNALLEPVAEKLDKGQVSDILTVPGAFMIIKVDDKHNGGILPFELAQREVFDRLWQQAVPGKIREYLTKLRTDGFVRTADGYTDLGAPDKSAAKGPDKAAAKD